MEKLNRYKVSYNGREYTYRGKNGYEAINKMCNRSVFGKPMILKWKISMVDADTRGEEWVEGYAMDGCNVQGRIIAVLENL